VSQGAAPGTDSDSAGPGTEGQDVVGGHASRFPFIPRPGVCKARHNTVANPGPQGPASTSVSSLAIISFTLSHQPSRGQMPLACRERHPPNAEGALVEVGSRNAQAATGYSGVERFPAGFPGAA